MNFVRKGRNSTDAIFLAVGFWVQNWYWRRNVRKVYPTWFWTPRLCGTRNPQAVLERVWLPDLDWRLEKSSAHFKIEGKISSKLYATKHPLSLHKIVLPPFFNLLVQQVLAFQQLCPTLPTSLAWWSELYFSLFRSEILQLCVATQPTSLHKTIAKNEANILSALFPVLS